MFDMGNRVMTPFGAGVVVSRRMAPPNYVTVIAYTVKLDSRKGDPVYTGTAILAKDVTREQ